MRAGDVVGRVCNDGKSHYLLTCRHGTVCGYMFNHKSLARRHIEEITTVT